MRIFIVGAGATGGLLGRVLRRRGHTVRCGDRDPERARAFVGRAIRCVSMDARSATSVAEAASGCQLLVNAAPAAFNESVIEAALSLGVHYLDMAAHLDRDPFAAEQLQFHQMFQRRKRLALISAGAAPGLTNVLVALGAERFDEVHQVQIRLFEQTESSAPVSTWSAEVAHDEAISKPRVYRDREFRFARRFSGPEWFRFPKPAGLVRVYLAAQDEVGTLPHFLPISNLDVKIGGNEIERLRRWYRQGRLRPSHPRNQELFPETASPATIADLLRRGRLTDARFMVCAVITGHKGWQWFEHRRSCRFPSLHQLRRKLWLATPVAFAAAQSAAVFVEHFPTRLSGVYPPEALPSRILQKVVLSMSRRGCRFAQSTVELRRSRSSRS